MLKQTTIWALWVSSLLLCEQASPAVPRGSVQAIACAPSNRKVAATLINDAIWVTLDRGDRWQQVAKLSESSPLPVPARTPDMVDQQPQSALPTTPREKRLSWENPGPAPDATLPDSLAENNPRALAVGDDGTFAVSFQGRLITGDPAAGVRRRIPFPGIRGLFIDQSNRLWITVQNALELLTNAADGGKGRKRFNIPGAGEPIRSFRFGELLIFGHAGLYKISFREKNDVTISGPYPLPAIEAVAIAPMSHGVYAVSLKRLVRLSHAPTDSPFPFAQAQDVGPAPSPVRRLMVDNAEQLYVLTDRSGWMKRTAGTWQRLQIRALDVDADGRPWFATDFGPMVPKAAVEVNTTGVPEGIRFDPLRTGAISKHLTWPGAPPCRNLALNPLPVCRWFVHFGRSLAQQLETPTSTIGARHSTEFYIGMQFIWRFEPLTKWRCVPEQVRFLAERNQRIREVEALWRSLQHTVRLPRAAGDLFQAVVSQLNRRHVKELIRIKTGTYPPEEEP